MLGKLGWVAMWQDAEGKVRTQRCETIEMAQFYAIGKEGVGGGYPLVFQAQEVRP